MADAIVSVVAEQIGAILKQQIQKEVNLVRGVDQKVLHLSNELQTVRNVLEDAERKRFKEKSVRGWLVRLEDASYEMEEVLDDWYIALLKFELSKNNKLRSFVSCLCFQKLVVHRDIANKIEIVKSKLDLILAEKDKYGLETTSSPSTTTTDPSGGWRVQTTSVVDVAEFLGRDNDREVVASKILADHQLVEIVSIVGVGGVGKTALAQLVYNDNRVKDCFELAIWICISDPFDEVGIAKKIVENVTGSSPDSSQLEVLVQLLKECISGKKFLLVMDDVWEEDSSKWEPLKNSLKSCGGIGSKVLVTTRNEKVAKMMGSFEGGIHHLGVLSDEACWLLLQRIALFRKSEEECAMYKKVGMEIARKCRGLPLAAKTLGSLLSCKNGLEEWGNVLNSEIWELEEAEVDIFPHLLLSYNELSPALKRCFSYCAVFPKDTDIKVEEVIGHWMALGYLGSDIGGAGDGYMELRGQQYFHNLAMRSLFQDFKKDKAGVQINSFKLHDIVHDFARFLRKNGAGVVEAGSKKKKSCQAYCSPELLSQVKEYRSLLIWNYEDSPVCMTCLSSLRVLCLRIFGIPQGLEKFVHLRWLDCSHKHDLSVQDLETICNELYNLQTLLLKDCNLEEIPKGIGNLIRLRHLYLCWNKSLKELPESICDLCELQTLDISSCINIARLPQGIDRLVSLKHFHNSGTQLSRGLAQLTCLRTLTEFQVGKDMGKLGWLKNLNLLSGSLNLKISLTGGSENMDVEDAREGELCNKEYLQRLILWFDDEMDEVEDCVRMDVMDALQPHPNLQKLTIYQFKGSRLPGWIASPLNQVKHIRLLGFSQLTSLPPLGKLPCLEGIEIFGMQELRFVGPEFLGITMTETGRFNNSSSSSSSSSSTVVYFPKLKNLRFSDCPMWEGWEDITDQDEEDAVSLMPHLTKLSIIKCNRLAALPHRLLCKAPSLEKLEISYSAQLQQLYGDKEGSPCRSISNINPSIQLIMSSLKHV